ncbi:MAG: ABC transporter permease [Chloroflexi bacterium]|nr:ABC transporter permease [Chloroflexota bacterium]
MNALRALYVANGREFLRERINWITTILMPLFFAGFFGLIFSGTELPGGPGGTPLRMVDMVFPGMLGLAMLWLGLFGTTMPLVGLREQQVLRRLGVTPLSRLTILAAQVAWRVTVGICQSVLFVAFGRLAFGVQVVGNLGLLAAAVLLGTLVFVTMGYLLAAVSRSQDAATAITQIVNLPMMMLSSSFFSLDAIPSFLKPVVDFIPLTYLADAFRQLMVAYPPLHPLWLDFAVLGGWLVVLTGLSLRFFRWE